MHNLRQLQNNTNKQKNKHKFIDSNINKISKNLQPNFYKTNN